MKNEENKLYEWNILKCPHCEIVIAVPTYTCRRITDDFTEYNTINCVRCCEDFNIIDNNEGLMNSNRGLEVATVIKLT